MRPIKSVQSRRSQRRIAPYGAPGPWSDEEESLLGTMDDRKFARKFSRALSAVKKRRIRLGIPVYFAHRRPWTAEEDALLRSATDTEIAARLGRLITTVCIRRQRLGIPNFYWQERCGRQRNLSRKRDAPP